MLAPGIAFLVTLLLSGWFIHNNSPLQILDYPNQRSLHEIPIPRTGGIAILLGIVLAAIFIRDDISVIAKSNLWPGTKLSGIMFLSGIGLLSLVSFIDDLKSISARWRFAAHVLTSIIVVYAIFGTEKHIIVIAVSIIFLAWMINLYNFMDGMDGFASGMAICGFSVLGFTAYQANYSELALVCFLVVGSSLGFLVYNFPPARLFMGDTGSTVLGALAGSVLLIFHSYGIMPIWLGILIFSPFIIDSIYSLGRRVLNGERFWEAHRTHIYQRLVSLGWGHRKTVLWEYVLMLLSAGSAIGANRYGLVQQLIVLALWIAVYVLLVIMVSVMERKVEKKNIYEIL